MTDAEVPLQRRADPTDQAIATLARLIATDREEGGLSPGDRATLRRMNPAAILPPAAWRLLTLPAVAQAIALGTPGGKTTQRERAWAGLIAVMAEATRFSETPVGSILAGPPDGPPYAEQRFVHLLRARGAADVAYEARQALHWCAAQGAFPGFTDRNRPNGFGPFILAAALNFESDAERRAHAIARDYFWKNLPPETRPKEA
jgi:hypothetical protein